MLSKLINLTLILVIQEIEEVLKDYPEYPYQIALSVHELRNKLILHVLEQLPNYYTILEDSQQMPALDPLFLYSSPQEQEQVRRIIRQSIGNVLRENAGLISWHLYKKYNSPTQSYPGLNDS